MTVDAFPDLQHQRGASWLWLSVGTVGLAAVGNVLALGAVGQVYGRETTTMLDQAVAQDLVGLAVVLPLVVVLAVAASRGSVPARLAWLGAMSFTAYNYAIYCFSIQFGPLFLLWVAVLGGATWSTAGGTAALDRDAVRARLGRTPVRPAAWYLVGVGGLFTLLWLSDVVPALLSGDKADSAAQIALPTNPVHVLDLALFLPAVLVAGVQLLRGRTWGLLLACPLLVFLALTCLPVLVTPAVAALRGDPATWAVLAPLSLVLLSSLAALRQLLVGSLPPVTGTGREAGGARAARVASSTGRAADF